MKKSLAGAVALAFVGLTLAGCTADPGTSDATATDTATDSAIQTQTLNTDLAAGLPDAIKESGEIVSVNTGSFPPYLIVGDDNHVTGASADLGVAIGEILGVDITHSTVDGLASVLTGMEAGRYDLDLGPIGDFTERQSQAQFIDYVQEFVVFAVEAGNPKEIVDLDSTCGTKIAVQAAGSAERVINTQSEACVAAGNEAVEIQAYKDQPSSILAVQSGRADAFFSSQAPLTYFVEQSDGALELSGVGEKNGFDDLFQGAVVPLGSTLGDTVLAAIEILHENGTYNEIMEKWNLEGNILETPGLNLGKS